MTDGFKSAIPISISNRNTLPVIGAGAMSVQDEALVRRAARAAKPKTQDLEDVEQAVREEFWRRAGSYDAATGVPFHGFLWPYLVGAARHVVRTDRDVRRRDGLGFDIPTDDLVIYDAPTACDTDLDHVTAMSVRRFVRGLDSITRYIIFRRYWEDMSFTQIAREIGMRPQSVQRRHDKALAEARLTLPGTTFATTVQLDAVAA